MAGRTPPTTAAARLYGLVLAGGRGTRLERDKGALDYHGVPQAGWAFELLAGLCERRFVSVRTEQADMAEYRDLPLLTDRGESQGPASGLQAALEAFPGMAWLVIAADMPLLDGPLLAGLVEARDAGVLATAYRHPDGTPEPLCAIWEPAVRPVLEERQRGRGTISLRRVLEAGPAKLLEVRDGSALVSVNTPADDARVREQLAAESDAVPGIARKPLE